MKLGLITATIVMLAGGAHAQHAQHPHGGGGNMQTGQAQFAAIGEIVQMLRDDPQTNWEMVNVDALRAHLVDMDNVTTRAAVDTTTEGLEVSFDVRGDAEVAGSIQRMVLAHSPMLQGATGWAVASEKQPHGARMRVTAANPAERAQITGLGFFGLLTLGAHHQQHHLMMAMGHAPH